MRSPNINGILGGDLAGFPNGRRVIDDVVTIELRAVAGLTYPLVDDTFTPDGAAALINDGTAQLADVTYLDRFPYLDHPVSGYDVAVAVRGAVVTGDHGHGHDHGPLEAIDHVHGGAMVLDIGGSVGALHVVLDDEWVGREVFLATDDPTFTVHTGVWVRHVGRRSRRVGVVRRARGGPLPRARRRRRGRRHGRRARRRGHRGRRRRGWLTSAGRRDINGAARVGTGR